MERWVEPEPSLGREITLHLYVSDEKAILKGLSLERETEHSAQGGARSVGSDNPI